MRADRFRPVTPRRVSRSSGVSGLGSRTNAVKKSLRGRTTAVFTPLRVRGQGVPVDAAMRDRVAQRLATLLGKFATRLTGVSVRFRDISGPVGAPARECAIRVSVSGHGLAQVSSTANDPLDAFETAAASLERMIRRLLERKRATRRA